MKKIIVLAVFAAAFSSSVFAYTDSQLTAIRDGFDGRRDGMLASQVSSPYPDPNAPDTGTASWGLEDYALSVLYLRNSTAEQIASANGAIINACVREKADPTFTNLSTESFHWRGNLFFRLYKFFSHDAKDPNFRGRLTPEAEAALCDLFWNYAKYDSKVTDAETAVSKTWYIWGSENHGAMRCTTNYSAAAILKDVAPYNTYKYNDGKTAKQHYDAWNSFFKEYLRERAKKGLCVEIGTHTYTKYTLQGWYNFYDFAEDPNLARLGGMILDLWWADWAEDQINGVRGGGKTRVYQGLDGADLHGADDAAYAMCWYYFGIGVASSKHPGVMCLATSKYRLPLVVMDLALDITGRGTYESKSRRPGLNLLPRPGGISSDIYVLDPSYGGLYRYVYATPSFVIGSLMLEKRAAADWSAISGQNRWQGVIFKTHADARIIPQCVGTTKTYNQHWAVQNKGTLIVQKLNTSTNSGAMRVYFSKSPMRFAAINEENGWVFANAGDSYAAVRPATGSYSWDDPNWMKMSDQYAAVIIEVAESKDYTDFTAFKTAVKARPLSVVSNVLTYTGLKDNGTFTFYTSAAEDDANKLPKINGVPINLKPSFTFDSPFVHEDWASGDVTIHKNSRMCHLNFNTANKDEYDLGHFRGDLNTDCFVDVQDVKIIADNWLAFDKWLGEIVPLPLFMDGPFADNSTTVALWHMDSTYTGTDTYVRVADDDLASASRNHELMLGSARAGYTVTTRPTLSSPGFDGTGGCLFFDGVNDETISSGAWPGCDSVLADVWIYPTLSANSHMIVDAGGTWSLSLETNKLHFTTLHSDSSSDNYSWPSDITLNQWHHVQAIMTNQGRKQLTLDGVTNTILTSGPSIRVQTKEIIVGKKTAATWYFNGYIDEVRVASIDPAGYRIGTVNLRDWAIAAQDWLKCTDPANPACETSF